MKPIAKQWQSYMDHVMPKNAPGIQIVEMRRAFYAGALAFYSIMMNDLANTDSDVVTRGDLDLMQTMVGELVDFGKSVPRS